MAFKKCIKNTFPYFYHKTPEVKNETEVAACCECMDADEQYKRRAHTAFFSHTGNSPLQQKQTKRWLQLVSFASAHLPAMV